MFRLLSQARATGAGPRGRFVSLRLESLDGRYTPSAPMIADPDLPAGKSPHQDTYAAAPQIVDFAAEEVSAGVFVITGKVVAPNPGGMVITFGGNIPGVPGRTATAAADGTFSIVIRLGTGGTEGGWVTATTVGTDGQVSNEPSVFISPTTP